MTLPLTRRAAMILPLAAALPGRARAAMPEITDALGRKLALRAPAERIVVGFNFEEFTAVAGAPGWDRVVGLDRQQWAKNRAASWARYQKAIPRLSGLADIGQATGSTDRAQALADLYRDRVADIGRRVAGKPAPRACVELGYGGPGVMGNTYNGAMWGRMIGFAGGANIATDRIPVGWAPMSSEAVLTAAPEHIFITASSWANAPNAVRAGYDVDIATTRRTLAPYADRPSWSALPAIRAGELHAVETGLSRSLWDWVGTQYIAKQLHPDAFADIDPAASLADYHARFLPVKFEGCWMAREG